MSSCNFVLVLINSKYRIEFVFLLLKSRNHSYLGGSGCSFLGNALTHVMNEVLKFIKYTTLMKCQVYRIYIAKSIIKCYTLRH